MLSTPVQTQFLVVIQNGFTGEPIASGGLFDYLEDATNAVVTLRNDYFTNDFLIVPFQVGKIEVKLLGNEEESEEGYTCVDCGSLVDDYGLCENCKLQGEI